MAGGLDGSFRFRSRPVLLDFDVIGHPAREDRPFDLTALGVEQCLHSARPRTHDRCQMVEPTARAWARNTALTSTIFFAVV